MNMEVTVRAAMYNASSFGVKYPASHLWVKGEAGNPAIYGIWMMGNDYRNRSPLYGAYPHQYLDRVMKLFPDAEPKKTLHLFSGSLEKGEYRRCDMVKRASTAPEFQCDAMNLPTMITKPRLGLVLADPPYSAEDAIHYNTPMVNRGATMRMLSSIMKPKGLVVWLDTCWPMYRKTEWRVVGRIWIIRSTNHRFRGVTIFQRNSA